MSKGAENKLIFTVLNPQGVEKEITPVPLAVRISDLGGKVVYCISQYIGGSDIFLQKVADLLPQYGPGVKTVYKRKPANYQIDDPDFWDEVRKEADAVIYGCGA
jgi:hypothetical protein